MSRWHHDNHAADEETDKHASPLDALAERLKRLAREAREAELERRLIEDKGRKGKNKDER
jgi:hypothetical protein